MNAVDQAARHLNAAATATTRAAVERHFTQAWILLLPTVRQHAATIVGGDPQLIDDATSEAGMKVWDAVRRAGTTGTIIGGGLVNTIAHHAAVNVLRRHKRGSEHIAQRNVRRSFEDVDGSGEWNWTWDIGGEEQEATDPTREKLEQAARAFEHRGQPVWAHIIRLIADGHTEWVDIAARMQCSPEKVRITVHRMRSDSDLRAAFGIDCDEASIPEQICLFAPHPEAVPA